MPATYTPITKEAMESLLIQLGFKPVYLDDTDELVYGKILRKGICCRVYTSIVGTASRDCGSDAIRVCVVRRYPDGSIRGIGKSQRVHRTQNWRKNLTQRINQWQEAFAKPVGAMTHG